MFCFSQWSLSNFNLNLNASQSRRQKYQKRKHLGANLDRKAASLARASTMATRTTRTENTYVSGLVLHNITITQPSLDRLCYFMDNQGQLSSAHTIIFFRDMTVLKQENQSLINLASLTITITMITGWCSHRRSFVYSSLCLFSLLSHILLIAFCTLLLLLLACVK